MSILGIASLLVRSYPNSGHRAGYDAVDSKGSAWVQSELRAAEETALPACNELYSESESSTSSPRYEYDSFIEGCGEAVNHLTGRAVPLLPASG